MSTSVAGLVEAARLGSAEARDELVRRHFREAAALAAALVNDPTEAEDLCQEAFVRAFRNLDLLADPSKFAAWLRRIVVGVSIDWLRSFRPDLYRGWDDADGFANASRDPSPLDDLLQSEMVRRVGGALDRLPEKYRVPLRLYHLDGLSHRKIAETLGVPVATVRSLVARARRKLAPLIADYAASPEPQIHEVFKEPVVTASGKSRFLHVANGTSTTSTIAAASIPGALSIWADPLYEGPVPGGLSHEELMEVRVRYLTAPDDGPVDPVNDMRAWRSAIANHNAYEELLLWYEHDLFDQLNLLQLLPFVRDHVPAAKAVSLICVGSFPGRPVFKGLGELTPDELASLLETRQPVTTDQYAAAATAWMAFRAPTPDAIDALRRRANPALPYLAPALDRFLQEYPWTRDGLSRTERRLLQLLDDGATTLASIFPRMHEGEDVYYVTDLSLFFMASSFSHTSPPLVTMDTLDREQPLRASAALTNAGRSVLAGTLDRVEACGLDRWLGGVHLERGAQMWRWHDEEHRIVKT
jgi:RNA polymerase sigma factor (sigma-70 family)